MPITAEEAKGLSVESFVRTTQEAIANSAVAELNSSRNPYQESEVVLVEELRRRLHEGANAVEKLRQMNHKT